MANPMRGLRAVRLRQARIVNRIKAQHPTLAAEIDTIQFDWYRIRNVQPAGAPARTEIFIYDEIGGPCSDLQASELVQEISAIDTPEILVRINSPGGSVYDAIGIYNALVQHDAHITTRIDSMCASAATIIAMAGHTVEMMLGSQMMIHEASMVAEGNPALLRETAEWLDDQSQNIANMYAARSGNLRNADEWRTMMQAETWMYGAEAIENHLADRMYERPEREPLTAGIPSQSIADEGIEDDSDDEVINESDSALELLMRRDHVANGRTKKYRHKDRAHAAPPPPVTNEPKSVMAALAAGW